MKTLTLILICLLPLKAFSFNWNKCSRKWIDKSSWVGEGAIVSTLSFFSSTGECAMLGILEHDKKVYFVHNFEKMKEDFARGEGEYARSFAKMHGCNVNAQKFYPLIMRAKFNDLDSVNGWDASQGTYEYLEQFFIKEPVLKENCNIEA